MICVFKVDVVDVDWVKLLVGKMVVVIGVSCGIGEVIVYVLVCDGVYVICLDVL